MMPRWFLYLQGFAMIIMGVAQLRLRPRAEDDSFYTRYINLGTMWSLICCAVGIALLGMAQGYWTWPPTVPSRPPLR
ncbi:MAG TPA: hypothetical protein VH877_25345 [Polyangia bacterium]|jgi:hypothetical protein|nr:hypothetical protein [Polyangia bacterium]